MKARLLELLDRLPSQRIAVLGDFMLDQFTFGEISRISREAPVLILRHQHTEYRPGGAANTVANLSALGVKPLPIGCIGDDETGRQLLEVWPAIDTRRVILDPSLRTTRKVRLLAGSFHSSRQQVIRLDYEHRFQLSRAQENQIESALEEEISGCGAVIISDYSLGNLTPSVRQAAISLCRKTGTPILVDSRDDPGGYHGTTAITPNISELEPVIGQPIGHNPQEIEEHCLPLLHTWDIEALLVTRGRLGMSLIQAESCLHLEPHGSQEAVDVTGAGDTVVAVFAAALAAGAEKEEAARLANFAGGLVVMKKGTAAVSRSELQHVVEDL